MKGDSGDFWPTLIAVAVVFVALVDPVISVAAVLVIAAVFALLRAARRASRR